ncbi:type VI secretion protein VasK [Klebsiella pneumoniae]|uniref:Type VI secretion protein VasK n=1 Tax=Klebsiella pneumoniae TaxID=573 RepID=A0A2X3EJL5_KLEPN|nr:type VI secretion protein VasK [Klebsiella pneumoniae]
MRQSELDQYPAGTRQYGDFPGAWGWIRLLDKAVVSAYPGTSSSWSLSWKAPDGLLLNYTLRTEAGKDRWRCWRCETLRYRRRYSACARLLNVFR